MHHDGGRRRAPASRARSAARICCAAAAPSWPIAAMVTDLAVLSASMITPRSTARAGCVSLMMPLPAARGVATARLRAGADPRRLRTAGRPARSRSLSSADNSPRALSTCLMSSNALLPRLRRRPEASTGMAASAASVIDQQHVELLAHQRLERPTSGMSPCALRECAAPPRTRARRPRPAACRHRAARGSTASRSPPAGMRDLSSAIRFCSSSRCSGLFARLAQRARRSRDRCRPRPAASASRRPTGTSARPALSLMSRQRVERRDDLPGHVLLHGDERIVGGHRPAVLADLLGQRADRRHHRICVGEQLVLQPQRMHLLHPFGHRRARPCARTMGCANVR